MRVASCSGLPLETDPLDLCLDYCDTVTSNIDAFLKAKTRQMNFKLETAKEDFRVFWERIGAQGDLSAALAEWDKSHNPSVPAGVDPLMIRLGPEDKAPDDEGLRFR